MDFESLQTDVPLTDSARRMLAQARERAGDRGIFSPSQATAVALVFWTIIRWERKVGLAVLETLGVPLDRLASKIDALLNERAAEDVPTFGTVHGRKAILSPDYTDLLSPLIAESERAARRLGHSWIGTEHLVLGAIATADEDLTAILQRHLITRENYEPTLVELLSGPAQ